MPYMFCNSLSRLHDLVADVRGIGGATIAKQGAVFLLKVIGAASALAINVIVARALSPSDAGYYFLAVSLVTFLYAVARLGLGYWTARSIAQHAAHNDWSGIAGTFWLATAIVTTMSAATVGVSYYFAPALGSSLDDPIRFATIFGILILTIPLFSIGSILSEVLKGLRYPLLFTLFESVIIKVATVALVYWTAAIWGLHGAGYALLTGNVAGFVFVAVAVFFCARPIWSLVGWGTIDKWALTTTFYFTVISLATVGYQWLTPVVVGRSLGPSDAALFFTAYRTSALLDFVQLSVAAVGMPEFIKAFSLNGHAALVQATRDSVKAALLWVCVLAAPILVWAPQIMSIYGPDYTAGATALRILTVAQLLTAPLALYSVALIASKSEHFLASALPISSALTLVLVLFGSSYGVSGSAMGLAMGTILQTVALAAFFESAATRRQPIS